MAADAHADDWPTLVDRAVRVFLDNPRTDLDGILAALEGAGMAPEEPWLVHQFVPTAFFRYGAEFTGIHFAATYILWTPETNRRESRSWASHPLYRAALTKAAEWWPRLNDDQGNAIIWRSAECATVQKVARPDGDLRGIQLTEMLLVDFAPTQQ